MNALFKKEIRKFFLFFIPCIAILPIAYHFMFFEKLPYLLFGVMAIFLAALTVRQFMKTYFILKLKKYIKKKKINAKEEKVIFYNKSDILLTKTSIYLLNVSFLSKTVSFSYQQLDCVKRISNTLQIGFENVVEIALVFTLIDGSIYQTGYNPKGQNEDLKRICLEKNPRIIFNF